MSEKYYYVYILANPANTVLYTGVTSDLVRRVYEHKNKVTGGFTAKYNVSKLVYFESVGDIESAIAREKQIKGGSRAGKVKLIEAGNPSWEDMCREIASS